ncbi:MAG: ATP-binding protein [Ruminococcaceae bacterium]|nr:ATP-binding protein [Oscillospiraceae bacterium]
MAYSKQIYDIATQKLNDRRNSALNMAEYRKNKLYIQFPRLSEIDAELSSVAVDTAKAVLSGKDVATQLSSLKEISLNLQNEYNEILTSNGYEKNYLDPQFTCEKCFDTGYVESNNKTLTCECYKNLLSSTACEQLNKISPLSLSTFDSFNLDYYSEIPDENGNVPYKRMSKIFDFCLDYAKNFKPDSKGILMKGDTGLGKTHLSLAIANEVIKNGYSVVYVSAPDILSKLEREHFSYDHSAEQELMQSLIDCDLLILDDLGTEFTTQFSSTSIYNLFNTRINMGKPVIINTNLTGAELEKTYSQRFVSRVMASCSVLDFIGQDIRAKI